METVSATDVIKTLGLIRSIYPNAYPTKTDEDERLLIGCWVGIFRQTPKELFNEALKRALTVSEFAPKPATVVNELNKIRKAFDKSASELWSELTGALYAIRRDVYIIRMGFQWREENGRSQARNASERVKARYDGLDERIRDYVRRMDFFMQMAEMDADNLSYERGRFLKLIPEIMDRAEVRRETSERVSDIIQGIESGKGIKRIDENK